MPEPKGKGYTFHGSGGESRRTHSIFGRNEAARIDDIEMETETEQFDDVQAHLDKVDFTLQEDRAFASHELQHLEHVLMDAKRKMEGMRRNPMVTNELVKSIEVKWKMLRDLLDEHYAGNESDAADVVAPRSTNMKKAA